ncbi:MAG TPA: hypothetical protein PLX50_04585, partial [Candidatus Aminicenantes bacterium]|nr:hypothetical protein [Candidatus Aminicenantes bacterium]
MSLKRMAAVLTALAIVPAAVFAGGPEGSQNPALEANDFVYVCRDAGAGGYEAFPDVCRLRDGR